MNFSEHFLPWIVGGVIVCNLPKLVSKMIPQGFVYAAVADYVYVGPMQEKLPLANF
jgi:hypothetical protein